MDQRINPDTPLKLLDLVQAVMAGQITHAAPLIDWLTERDDSRADLVGRLLAELRQRLDDVYLMFDEEDFSVRSATARRLNRVGQWWHKRIERLFFLDLNNLSEVLPLLEDDLRPEWMRKAGAVDDSDASDDEGPPF